ncbi:MAG: RHS domain-containing protein, partial [Blastocatellia bacterium]|nr:RHS domain-containing protein [Blastocatellia bacterium]
SRLKSVNGAGSTYGYDGNGGRVRVTDGGEVRFYVRSSVLKNVAMEVNSTGVRRAYVYAGRNHLVAEQSTDGQFYWLHTNHLGSARAMTDSNGNLVYRGQFDPYGQVLTEWSSSGNNNLNTKKFTGYERDATGLDYANARMYNSGRGRYMQPDAAGLNAASFRRPQSLNLYSYVENDPVNRYDPTGRNGISVNPCSIIFCGSSINDSVTTTASVNSGGIGLSGEAIVAELFDGGGDGGGGDPGQDIQALAPSFSETDQTTVDQALNMARNLVNGNIGCDEALKNYGVPSLAALVAQLRVSGGVDLAGGPEGQNVFDGRRATAAEVRDDDGVHLSGQLSQHTYETILLFER